MSILEKLYNGNILPVEKVIPKSADYRPLASKIGNEREYFAATRNGLTVGTN